MYERLIALGSEGVAAVVVALLSATAATIRAVRIWTRRRRRPLSYSAIRTVLIVEDDLAHASAVARVLRELPGVAIEIVGTIAAAEGRLAAPAPPSVILLDCYLPDGNGWELAARITRRSRIILMSAMLDDGTLQRLAAGVGALCLAKPMDLDELLQTVRGELAAVDGG